MSIKTIMSTNVVTIKPDDLLSTASQVMLWSGGRHLPVVEEGRTIGVLSEGDLFRARSKTNGDQRMLVRAAMTSPVKTATPGESIAEVAARMAADKIGCLPVLENGRLVGIVTTTDLLTAIEAQAFAKKQTELQDGLGVEVLSLRGLRDRARLKAHLGRMDLRDAWRDLQVDIAQAERLVGNAADGAASFVRKVRQRAEKMIGDARQRSDKGAAHPPKARAGTKTRGNHAAHK